MATHDYNLANQDGASFRSDLNNALSAIVSNNSSSTAPATTFAHQIWVDTTANVIKQRNAANDAWVELWRIDGGFNAKTFNSNVTLNAQSDLRFADSDSSNWVAFQAPATVASNVTWTLPSADGTADQALTTNGSGVLSWADAGGTADNITEGNTSAEVVDTGSDGHFKVITEGSERVRIIADGKVGIGVTDPAEELEVSGSGGCRIALNRSGNDGYGYIGTGTTNDLQFGRDGSGSLEYGRFDSSGRLLVGTSSARSADFVTARIQHEGTNQNNSSIQLTCNSSASTGTAPELNFSRSRGSAVGSNTAVGSGDNLGIINFTGADGTDLNSVAAQIRGVVDNNTGSNDMPGRLGLYTTNDTQSSPTERMRITSKGFLKASPRVTDGTHGAQRMSSTVHEFTCDDNDWVMQMTHTSGSGAEVSGLYIKYSQVSPNNTSQDFHYAADSTALRFSVRSNGGVANYQSNDVNLCDEREKKNIVNLDSTWDCLKQWELKKFHYNEDLDEDDLRYGVIAQQVATHCPEVITDWVKQKAEDAVLDEDGNVVTPAVEEVTRLAVKEQQMYWMAIRALQEAQTRIEALETANASLEARLTALENA